MEMASRGNTPVIYRICGDRFLMLELGDEVDLQLNFKAISMKDIIEKENIQGERYHLHTHRRRLAVSCRP